MTEKVVSNSTVTEKKVDVKSENITKNQTNSPENQNISAETEKHIQPGDEGWEEYMQDLIDNVKDDIETGKYSFYTAWLGFIDDEELGFPDIYDRNKLFRILTINGYCQECAENFIEYYYIPEVREDGKKARYGVIDRDENDFFWMEEEFNQRLAEQTKNQKKMKRTKKSTKKQK